MLSVEWLTKTNDRLVGQVQALSKVSNSLQKNRYVRRVLGKKKDTTRLEYQQSYSLGISAQKDL